MSAWRLQLDVICSYLHAQAILNSEVNMQVLLPSGCYSFMTDYKELTIAIHKGNGVILKKSNQEIKTRSFPHSTAVGTKSNVKCAVISQEVLKLSLYLAKSQLLNLYQIYCCLMSTPYETYKKIFGNTIESSQQYELTTKKELEKISGKTLPCEKRDIYRTLAQVLENKQEQCTSLKAFIPLTTSYKALAQKRKVYFNKLYNEAAVQCAQYQMIKAQSDQPKPMKTIQQYIDESKGGL